MEAGTVLRSMTPIHLAAAVLLAGCSDSPAERAAATPGPAPAATTSDAATRSTTTTAARAPAAEVAAGAALYEQHCAMCHGPGGRGGGPMARLLTPPPRGLADEAWRFFDFENAAEEREGLERVVRWGLPESGMPASTMLDDQQISTIVTFILDLRTQ